MAHVGIGVHPGLPKVAKAKAEVRKNECSFRKIKTARPQRGGKYEKKRIKNLNETWSLAIRDLIYDDLWVCFHLRYIVFGHVTFRKLPRIITGLWWPEVDCPRRFHELFGWGSRRNPLLFYHCGRTIQPGINLNMQKMVVKFHQLPEHIWGSTRNTCFNVDLGKLEKGWMDECVAGSEVPTFWPHFQRRVGCLKTRTLSPIAKSPFIPKYTLEDERLEPAITHEKKGKWSEPNLHIFHDYVPAVNLQGCMGLLGFGEHPPFVASTISTVSAECRFTRTQVTGPSTGCT